MSSFAILATVFLFGIGEKIASDHQSPAKIPAHLVGEAFTENDAAVDENIVGKEVELVGKIKRIVRISELEQYGIDAKKLREESKKNIEYVVVMSADRESYSTSFQIYLSFPAESRKELADLSPLRHKGPATIRARFKAKINPHDNYAGVHFSDCKIIDVARVPK